MTFIENLKRPEAQNEAIAGLNLHVIHALRRALHDSSLDNARQSVKSSLGTNKEQGTTAYALGKVFEIFAYNYLHITQNQNLRTILSPQATARFFLALHPEAKSKNPKRGMRKTWHPNGMLIEHSDDKKITQVKKLYQYGLKIGPEKIALSMNADSHISEVNTKLIAENEEPFKRANNFLSVKFHEKDLILKPANDLKLMFILPSDIPNNGIPDEMIQRLPIKNQQFKEFYKTVFVPSIH
ncbi:MAG: hypothetical protein KBC00_01930 [Candidatus Levybacteria bacterium]|nr:hypothetical protein [Candidatus Levybacteria bacterium]MBP9815083.1 hypothetical protein [Candidatus Levybacteria bacterium]